MPKVGDRTKNGNSSEERRKWYEYLRREKKRREKHVNKKALRRKFPKNRGFPRGKTPH